MNIYADPGTKVRYLNRNGYDGERNFANQHLHEGVVYTVDHTAVYSWSSEVCLVEVPDYTFNTVMFEEV